MQKANTGSSTNADSYRAGREAAAKAKDTAAVAAAEVQTDAGQQMVMGVAERRAELGGAVVTYQMELPVCGSPSELLAQATMIALLRLLQHVEIFL